MFRVAYQTAKRDPAIIELFREGKYPAKGNSRVGTTPEEGRLPPRETPAKGNYTFEGPGVPRRERTPGKRTTPRRENAR